MSRVAGGGDILNQAMISLGAGCHLLIGDEYKAAEKVGQVSVETSEKVLRAGHSPALASLGQCCQDRDLATKEAPPSTS